MKKLFNNSTKGNDTQNQSSKSKRKFLKTFSFTSLALLMGIAGTMAFAPLGASPNNLASASEMLESTTEQGLIIPKADDPVIYTTESGLEIKRGNALSGNLTAFPYLTTTDGSTTYYWVIIGVGPVENVTPAGQEIYKELSKQIVLGDNTQRTEIPVGCVLVLANDNVATGICNKAKTFYTGGGNYYPAIYEDGTNMRNTMHGYYTNGSFGLSSIKSKIQSISLKTRCYGVNSNNSWGWLTRTFSEYIYPLACDGNGTFNYATYLTAAEIKLSTNQWLRGGTNSSTSLVSSCSYGSYINTSGARADTGAGSTAGYRPAFCLKLF